EVRRGPLHEQLAVEATVQPMTSVPLTAAEAGRVERIFIEVGSIVREGDPIFQLTSQSLVMDILLRRGQVDQERNNLQSARLALDQFRLQLSQQLNDLDNQIQQQKKLYDRYLELDKDSLISKLEFERARDQYEYLLKRRDLLEKSQKSDLAVRNAQIENLERSVARMEENLLLVEARQEALLIQAPVYGQVTSLSAEVGQSKAAGDRLGQVDALSGFKATAVIDEKNLDRVEIQKSGTFEVDGRPFSLVVKKIFPTVKEGKFEVELEFKGDRPKSIKRGQTLHVRLEVGEPVEAVILPKGDFLATGGGEFVFKLDPDGKSALKTGVKLGRQNTTAVEVLRGLVPGDRVIVSSYAAFGGRERLSLKER
ncbi:MAG: HlyD family efflux transporter periplasmic adaptor subunit, partial [Candidatus Aminicenantes bacterium]|nr:HlyD family efflux transporter periplasmic adaptor subunit [Candidatus Aminicenantes bacterium]